jgi:hypothetical protein
VAIQLKVIRGQRLVDVGVMPAEAPGDPAKH